MTHLPNISTLSPTALEAYKLRVTHCLSSTPIDTQEAILLCTALPAAVTFVKFAACYHPDRIRREATKFLSPYLLSSPSSSPEDCLPLQGGWGSVSGGSSPLHGAGGSAPEDCLPLQGGGGSGSGVGVSSFTTPAGTVYTITPSGEILSVGGTRPNHFDEWKHLIPEPLASKINDIKSLFDGLFTYRQEVERLAADPNHSQADLARASRLTVAYEARLLNLFAQADACWEELTGHSVSDEVKRELAQEEHKLLKDIQTQTQNQTQTQTPHQTPQPPEGEQTPQPPIGGEIPTVSPSVSSNGNQLPLKGDGGSCLPLQGVGGSVVGGSVSAGSSFDSMTVQELMSLTDEQLSDLSLRGESQKYHLDRRVNMCQKYIRDKMPDAPSDSQRSRAIAYAKEIIAAKGKLSKVVFSRLQSVGIDPMTM